MKRIEKAHSEFQITMKKTEELQKYMDACAKAFDFSGAVLVAKNGKCIWSGATGLANREHGVKNSTKTKFRLASISKPFTAIAIMMLQEQGMLRLSDPVGKHLKKTPKAWKKITIRHLLTHTSGIPSYTDFPEYTGMAKKKLLPTELMATFKNRKLDFTPGKKFYYSNSGYSVLGLIIESISGKTYGQFLNDNIFKPLEMNDSGLDDNSVILPARAQGYMRTIDQQLKNANFIDMSVPYAAGGLYSTAEDLLRFENGLASGKLLSKQSMKTMLKPEKEGYACGWGTSEFNDRKIVGHAGGIDGFTTNFEWIESEKYCSIVLSNIEGSPVNLIADSLRSLMFDAPYAVPQKFEEVSVDSRILRDYEGKYELAPEFIVTVFKKGDILFAQATGQDKLVLIPHADDQFFFVQIYAHVSFHRGKKGNVQYMVLHQNGKEMKAPRLSKK